MTHINVTDKAYAKLTEIKAYLVEELGLENASYSDAIHFAYKLFKKHVEK